MNWIRLLWQQNSRYSFIPSEIVWQFKAYWFTVRLRGKTVRPHVGIPNRESHGQTVRVGRSVINALLDCSERDRFWSMFLFFSRDISSLCHLFSHARFWVNINLLLTEREGRTGEYWPEVVAVRTERSEVRTRTTEGQYIYLINQARGPYWENIGPRSWQYGPSAARSVHKRLRADILPIRSRANLVNKRFITRLTKAKTGKTQARDHSGQCPGQYLENIGPAIEQFDWLILVIGPPTAWVV